MVNNSLHNILIVDDQIPNLQVLTMMLKGKNYKVRKATDGETAIEAVQIEPPDLILLDIMMPGLDGYEVCKRLKSQETTKDIPIIFISALSEVFDKVKAFEVGGVDYITKPFQAEEVLARINNQLTIKVQKITLQREQSLLKKKQQMLEKNNQRLKEEIEARKKTEITLHKSKALIYSILTNSLDGIAALEAVRNPDSGTIEDFRYVEVNPIFAKLFDGDSDGLTGKVIFKENISKIDPKLFSLFVRVVDTGVPLEHEFRYDYKGEDRWYYSIAVKLADGFAINVRDITVRKRAELQLSYLANMDGLTGVFNRRSFDRAVAKAWQRSEESQQVLSLILFDVDYFKLYNDRYGHQAGDDCLVQVAQATKEAVKGQTDLVARYGGEEFTIILPKTDRAQAISVAQRVQEAISTRAIPHEKSNASAIVSVSLGIASIIPSSDRSPNVLIEMADRALYQAKQQGRDRYCFAE